MSHKDRLKTLGWSFYKSCRCGGVLQYKYKRKDRPGAIVVIYPEKAMWAYYQDSIRVKYLELSTIETTLANV